MINKLASYAPQMLQIEQAAHVAPWTENGLRSCFQDNYEVYGWFSATNALQGFYIAHQVCDDLTLMNIAVAPEVQGQGIGRQLLQHLLNRVTQLNAQLWLEVRASNRVAQALYLSLGFVEVGRRPDYYPVEGGREDALVMRWSAKETNALP